MRGIELSELTIKRGDKEVLRQDDFVFSPHELFCYLVPVVVVNQHY